jgi:hypothetical protein
VFAAVPALRPSWAGAAGEPAGTGAIDHTGVQPTRIGPTRIGPTGVDHGRPNIIDPPTGPWGSPVRCGDVVCSPHSNCVKCCPAQGGGGSCCPCYFSCTTSGSGLCNKQFACGPDGRPYCGPPGHCCALNEFCWRGSVCLPICKPNEQLCEEECCHPSTECIFLPPPIGRGKRICYPKCPRGRSRCGINCCPPRQKCINAVRGVCSPCGIGEKVCGRKCCKAGSTCCDPRTGLCCKRNETCAGYGGVAKCCPKGTRACEESPGRGPVCCKKGEACAQVADGTGTVPLGSRRYTCCPPERTVPFSGGAVKVCCPPGFRSLGGRVIAPPGGGGGLCCRNDKVCGDTCCGTNANPANDAACCNDRCVSLYFDAQNCGGCGRRCAPGQRCQQGRCVAA